MLSLPVFLQAEIATEHKKTIPHVRHGEMSRKKPHT